MLSKHNHKLVLYTELLPKMRLIKRHINRDGSGSVTLCPEEPEDMVRDVWSTPLLSFLFHSMLDAHTSI